MNDVEEYPPPPPSLSLKLPQSNNEALCLQPCKERQLRPAQALLAGLCATRPAELSYPCNFEATIQGFFGSPDLLGGGALVLVALLFGSNTNPCP
eukprot:4754889-Pyramimonas_sp.AAC.1